MTIEQLKQQAFQQANQEFNLDDDQQLGEIFFDKIGLSGATKNEQGQYSVTDEVLSQLNHPLANTILEYRKIKG